MPGGPSTNAVDRAARRLSDQLIGATGWKRRGLALSLGALAALALPPLYVLPLLVPAFGGLLWIACASRRPRDAFSAGAWFGFGHFSIGLYWVGHAFLVDAAAHGWAAPLAVLLLAAGMAVFPAMVACGVRQLCRTGAPTAIDVFNFAALWVLIEWVRGWLLTGFPWNLIGTVWTASDAMMQFTALGGVHGLGFVTVATMSAPALLCVSVDAAKADRQRLAGVALSVIPLAVMFVWGEWRLRDNIGSVDGVRLRLVQPAIPQHLKWHPEHRAKHVANQIKMSRQAAVDGPPPTHVIWAETAIPFFVSRDAGLRAALATTVPPGGALISGAPRTDGADDNTRVTNSIHAIDAAGRIVATYDKFHLVPFGEYIPFPTLLRISKLTAGRGDFSPGPGPQTITLPVLPAVSPLICYEIIFPDRIVDAANRPRWILNLTNDGWFGVSSGPYQHFAAARLRAVEQGLPLVRVANSGISAIVDAHGRVQKSLPLGSAGILDGELPEALATPTVFARTGGYPALIVAIVILAFGFMRRQGGEGGRNNHL